MTKYNINILMKSMAFFGFPLIIVFYHVIDWWHVAKCLGWYFVALILFFVVRAIIRFVGSKINYRTHG